MASTVDTAGRAYSSVKSNNAVKLVESPFGHFVKTHLTTGESATKHGQETLTGFLSEFVFVHQIHTVNMNSLMKPARIA